MIKKAKEVLTDTCPGLTGTTGSLADDGLCEPRAASVAINAFLNINAGLHGDEGVIDEDGRVVDPFGGKHLDGWV